MTTPKKCVLYSRVSTDSQTTENQLRELRAYAARMNYQIVATLTDNGISGSKGRKDRPAYNRLLEMVARKEVDIVLSWSVDRISRSLPDLLAFLGELKAKNVDLFLHKINGRDISFQTNVGTGQGESPVFPVVVGLTWDFSGQRQATILELADRRAELAWRD